MTYPTKSINHKHGFLPYIYILISKPIVNLENELMSNAHWMMDVPMKLSAQTFLDIIQQEAIPYINELEKTY